MFVAFDLLMTRYPMNGEMCRPGEEVNSVKCSFYDCLSGLPSWVRNSFNSSLAVRVYVAALVVLVLGDIGCQIYCGHFSHKYVELYARS